MKTIGFLRYRNKTLALYNFIRKLCIQNLVGRGADILRIHLRKTLKFLQMFPLCTVSTVALFVAYPFKAYIVDNELQSTVPIEIIFVDQSTTSGFVVANIVMSTMGILAYFFSVFYGQAFIFCIFNFSVQVDLIGEDFENLNEMWTDTVGMNIPYKRAFLRNICIKCQDMNK